jgi:phage host-nuclease inhibitor protein Gam
LEDKEMARAVTRIKKSQTSVPASLAEADTLIEQISQTQGAINQIQADLKREIADLRAKAAKLLRPLKIERDSQINALFAFADPRKEELTEQARSIELASGVFGWRWTPPRVATVKTDKETIAQLKKTGNGTFVRVAEQVNRQAILAERPEIDGIDCVQSDEFFVVPNRKIRKAKTVTEAVDR